MLAAKQTRTTSYGDTKELYRYTDCQQNEDKISSFYSGKAIGRAGARARIGTASTPGRTARV